MVAGQSTAPDISSAQFTVEINGRQLGLNYLRDGVPGSGSGRKNEIQITKEKQSFWKVEAGPTQDIYIRLDCLFHLVESSDKQLLLIVLFSTWDGEDPSIRPVFVVTDGSKVAATESTFDAKSKASNLEEMERLMGLFLGRPVTDSQREALKNVERELKIRR
jgi:hypothetical protein